MDLAIFNVLHQWAGHHKALDFLGVFFANYLVYLMIVAFLVLAFWENNWRQRCYKLFLGLLSLLLAKGLVVEAIRFFYQRPRPFVALNFKPLVGIDPSASFPSGHATAFFALAMAVFLFNRRWGYYFLAAAVLMGLGRIFVGVHWPSDIFGGAVLGIATALIVWWTLPRPN